MLSFRIKTLEGRFTLEHRGETLGVRAVRPIVRRHAPLTVLIRGPESFRETEATRDGQEWCRIEHGGSELWIRAFYPAASTADRFLVTFDGPADWRIVWARPGQRQAAAASD